MLSSSNNTLDLPRAIVPCVSWKTAKRAVRRARTSFTGENNRAKIAMTNSSGSGDNNNGTDEESKGTDQVPVSESEKFGVTILGRRFSDEIQNVPIKKRKCLLVVSSPPSVSVYETAINAESNCGVESLQDSNNHVDFSGISILADAACETEFPVPESKPSRSETGTVVSGEITEVTPAQKDENEYNDGLDKDSLNDLRFKWDLNTVMEAWECDEQDGSLAESPPSGADVAGKNENIICKDSKEGLGIICDEPMNDGMRCEEAELERLDLNEVEFKDESEIISQVEPPKESIVEESQTEPPKESVVEESNVGQVEPPKESIVEELNACQAEKKEANVGQVDLNGVELNWLNKPAVVTASNEDKENEIIKRNDQINLLTQIEPIKVDSEMEPSNEEPEEPGSDLPDLTRICDLNESPKISPTDSCAVKSMDDKAGPDSMQSDPSILTTVFEAEIENGGALKPDDEAYRYPTVGGTLKPDDEAYHYPTVGDSTGTEFCIEKKNENVGYINPDVSKDLNKKTEREVEEEEYQYEDGELREPPIIDYWAADPSGEELSKSERGAHKSYKHDINHLAEPARNDTLESQLPLSPQVETDNTQLEEIRDDWDTETNEKPEFLESKDLDERVKRNNGSSRAKRTGWDRPTERPTESDRDSFRRDPSSSRRSYFDGPRRNDKSFVRPRRSDEDEIMDCRANRRVADGNPRPPVRRDERGLITGPVRHRAAPAHQEFSAPSYAPSNATNATAASIAKVKSNGFVVAPDGTLAKVKGSGFGGNRRENNACLSRKRELSPPERFHHVGRSRVTDVCSRRGGKVHVNVIHGHLPSPDHVVSRSRSRTRSPNAWRRSPPCRARPPYDHQVSPHGARWVDDRRCMRTSPPPHVHTHLLTRGHSPVMPHVHCPVPPRRQRGEEYFHHHHRHLPAVHAIAGRWNGYEDNLGPHRQHGRSFNGDLGFRPRENNNKMTGFQKRGFDFDRRRPDREKRDGDFKFARGRGRNNNTAGLSKHHDMRDSHADDRDDDDERV